MTRPTDAEIAELLRELAVDATDLYDYELAERAIAMADQLEATT